MVPGTVPSEWVAVRSAEIQPRPGARAHYSWAYCAVTWAVLTCCAHYESTQGVSSMAVCSHNECFPLRVWLYCHELRYSSNLLTRSFFVHVHASTLDTASLVLAGSRRLRPTHMGGVRAYSSVCLSLGPFPSLCRDAVRPTLFSSSSTALCSITGDRSK